MDRHWRNDCLFSNIDFLFKISPFSSHIFSIFAAVASLRSVRLVLSRLVASIDLLTRSHWSRTSTRRLATSELLLLIGERIKVSFRSSSWSSPLTRLPLLLLIWRFFTFRVRCTLLSFLCFSSSSSSRFARLSRPSLRLLGYYFILCFFLLFFSRSSSLLSALAIPLRSCFFIRLHLLLLLNWDVIIFLTYN